MNNPAQVLDEMIADPTINGNPVDVDKAYGGQCWDLVELFAERLGVPKEPWAIPLGPDISAKEAWTYYDQSPHMQKYFDKIPAGQQQKGDITVYDGHGVYTEGHIAISLGGNAVFEENADPDGSVAHVYNNRSSIYLLGALRLKGGNTMPGLTQRNQDVLVKAFKQQDPTAVELADTNWASDPNLAITTLEAAYGNRRLNTGDVLNFMSAVYKLDTNDPTIQQEAKDFAALGWKEAMYGLANKYQSTLQKSGTPTGLKPYQGPQLFVKE